MSALSREELELFGPMTAPTAPSKPKITITDIPDEPAKVVVAVSGPRPTDAQTERFDEPAAVLPPDAPQNDAAATVPEKKRGRPAGAKNKPKDLEQTTALMVETAKETGVTFDPATTTSLEAQIAAYRLKVAALQDDISLRNKTNEGIRVALRERTELFDKVDLLEERLKATPAVTIELGPETLATLRKIFGV